MIFDAGDTGQLLLNGWATNFPDMCQNSLVRREQAFMPDVEAGHFCAAPADIDICFPADKVARRTVQLLPDCCTQERFRGQDRASARGTKQTIYHPRIRPLSQDDTMFNVVERQCLPFNFIDLAMPRAFVIQIKRFEPHFLG